MNNKDFDHFLLQVGQYLDAKKVFIADPGRLKKVYHAYEIARTLFPEADIQIADDPLQTGAAILKFSCEDITVHGSKEILLFSRLIESADNFEIYPCNDGSIKFAAVFYKTYLRIG